MPKGRNRARDRPHRRPPARRERNRQGSYPCRQTGIPVREREKQFWVSNRDYTHWRTGAGAKLQGAADEDRSVFSVFRPRSLPRLNHSHFEEGLKRRKPAPFIGGYRRSTAALSSAHLSDDSPGT